MKKKQLITSLALTGIMMGSIAGNAFADSSIETDTSNNITTLENVITPSEKVYKDNFTNTPDVISGMKYTTHDISTTTPFGCNDTFKVKVNIVNGVNFDVKNTPYTIETVVENGRLNVTLTMNEDQVRLGNLDNSANKIDSRRKLDHNRIQYKFHYSLLNLNDRTININVYPKNGAPALKI